MIVNIAPSEEPLTQSRESCPDRDSSSRLRSVSSIVGLSQVSDIPHFLQLVEGNYKHLRSIPLQTGFLAGVSLSSQGTPVPS